MRGSRVPPASRLRHPDKRAPPPSRATPEGVLRDLKGVLSISPPTTSRSAARQSASSPHPNLGSWLPRAGDPQLPSHTDANLWIANKLPADSWAQILSHLPFRERYRTSALSRTVRAGLRDSFRGQSILVDDGNRRNSFTEVTSRTLAHLSLISELRVVYSNITDSQGEALLVAACSNVEILSWSSNWKRPYPKTFAAIATRCATRLVDLDLAGTKITDQELSLLAKSCRNLRRIDLFGCEQITPGGFKALSQCANLSQVNVSYTSLDDDAAVHIAKNLGSLRGLNLNYCDGRKRSSGLSAVGVKSLLAARPELEEVALGGTPGIDDTVASAIAASCKGMKRMRLDGTQITDQGIGAIAGACGLLEELSLTRCRISDNAMMAVAAGCKGLLKITCQYTAVRDPGAVAIASCEWLEYVNIEDTEVGDEGCIAIAVGCKRLKCAYFPHERRISKEAKEAVAAACGPDVKIRYDDFSD